MRAGVTTALITVYSSAILVSWGRGWIMAPVLAAGYLFLYAALQSEDYALLIGSLGLLSILGAVMLLTRRVNWYGLRAQRAPGPRGPLDRTPHAAAADTTPPASSETQRR